MEVAFRLDPRGNIKAAFCNSIRDTVLRAYEEQYGDDPDSGYTRKYKSGVHDYMESGGNSAASAVEAGEERLKWHMFDDLNDEGNCSVELSKGAAIIKARYKDSELGSLRDKTFTLSYSEVGFPKSERDIIEYLGKRDAFFNGESLTSN